MNWVLKRKLGELIKQPLITSPETKRPYTAALYSAILCRLTLQLKEN